MGSELTIPLPSVFVLFIYFGAGLCILLSISDVARNGRTTAAFWVALCLGSIQLRFGLYSDGTLSQHPRLIFLFLTSVFTIGPVTMGLADSLIVYKFYSRLTLFWHLLPAIGIAMFEVVLSLQLNDEEINTLIAGVIAGNRSGWVYWVLVAGCLHELVYMFLVVKGYIKVKNDYDSGFTKMFVAATFSPAFTITVCLAGLVLKEPQLYFVGALAYTLTGALLFLFALQRPALLDKIRRDVIEKKYINSQLIGLDVAGLKSRLEFLMEEKRLYEDEELTLGKLAVDLGISYKSLSELLNGVYGRNFSSFINGYRIRRAEMLLKSNSNLSILDIAFAVGFNSKATFNNQFKKITGQTPSAFRKAQTEAD